jgi:hypothetical protein
VYEANKLPRIKLPCGSIASFDESSGISYRCEYCGSVVGSIGQPRECKEEARKYDLIKALGGKGWEYYEHIVEEEYDE